MGLTDGRAFCGYRRVGRGACLAISTACIALLGLSGVAQAATWDVTTTADTTAGSCQPSSCSLRQAIAAASDGDTIVLPASASPYQVVNGPLVIQSAVTISGAGAAATVISGAGGSTRVMNIFGNTGAVILRNLTITGGSSTRGGGIAAAGLGGVILDGVTVTGNTVSNTSDNFDLGGGGIYSTASLTLIDSTVSDNTATVTSSLFDGGGGGILMGQTSDNGDDLTLRDSTVTGNSVNVTADGHGAADANGGGGLYQDGGDLTITGSSVTGNTATIATSPTNTGTPTDGGGGIFMFGNHLLLEDSTVAGNTADGPGGEYSGGGGILDSGNQSSYLNDTITGNTTDVPASTFQQSNGGGGIMLNAVQQGVVIANSTINANTAPNASGGGINSVLTSTTEVTDSIVAGNSDSANNGNCWGPIDSLGYNLTDDDASNNTCSFAATGDILGASPRLGGLANNGGPTLTEALQAGSPAIAAGDPGGCSDLMGSVLTTDERGALRPTSGACDIGAYQVALPVVQTGTAFVTGSGVVLSGTASNPDPRAGSVLFEYGAGTAYGTTTATQALAGISGTTFTADITGLAPGTYHFRIVAKGADGSTNGADGVFTVPVPALTAAAPTPTAATPAMTRPSVTIDPPRAVSPTTATLVGAVNPERGATRAHFVWGLRGKRLTRTTPVRNVAAGTRGRAIVATITKLRPNTRYTVRLVASNAAGTTTGRTIVFRTARRRGRG